MNTTVNAGLYSRLSVEDETNLESTSIQTQKAMLTDYCQERGFHIVDYYVDDGETGTNFERPEFQRMLRDIEAGKINTVICKDLSRFGRNYYEAGMYLDKYFVERNIRFIAIQDNVDSAKGGYDLTVPFLNMMNDYYARGISQKTKAAKQTRAKQGMFLGSKAPYGYRKDPEDKHHLLIDDAAADVVCRIFNMAENGWGFFKIAKTLQSEGIPNPQSYADGTHDTRWHITSVQKILQNPAYCGDLVQGRRGNRTMHGKQIQKPEEEWITVQNTHEPLVSREQWEAVQQQIKSRKRSMKNGEVQISSLVETAVGSRCITSSDMLHRFYDDLASREAGKKNVLPSGFPNLDKVLGGGFLRGGLYIIAARPGMGKTTVAINLADNFTGGVLFVSLEMSPEQLTAKRLARETGIPSNRLLMGQGLTDDEYMKICSASSKLSGSGLIVNQRMGATVPEIDIMARSVQNLSAVVVDYMGLIQHKGAGSRYEAMTEISGALKRLAISLNVPVIALAQLNRAAETRNDKRPSLADLRDSGAIEQDADGVLLLYRADYYQKEKPEQSAWVPSLIECEVAKNRHAATGKTYFDGFLAVSRIAEARVK